MKRILTNLGLGLAAGAVGTEALNLTTYGDMVWRGRGASSVPSKVAGAMGSEFHIDAIARENQSDVAENRRSAAGALMGYATGIALGVVYGAARSTDLGSNPLAAALALGAGAMIAGDLPAIATGATDVRKWGKSDWLSDLVPHIAFGLATVASFELATQPKPPRRFAWLLSNL